MTEHEAAQLKQGDPVRISHGTTNHGRVTRLIGHCVVITWATGAEVFYSVASMDHIERTPEKTHD